MKLEVYNEQLSVGTIRVIGIAASSVLLIGDTEYISLSSVFDTPPESIVVTPLVPLAPLA